jgi:uncharacterized protein
MKCRVLLVGSVLALTLAGGEVDAKAGEQSVTLTAAGFDCSKAISPTGKRICADPSLVKMDREMAAAYGNVIQNTDNARAWKADQRAWLAERDLPG